MEREMMKNGELTQTKECGWCLSEGWSETERSRVYKEEDETGNNQVPYNWQQFGSDSFFGQTITHWMPIEPLTQY